MTVDFSFFKNIQSSPFASTSNWTFVYIKSIVFGTHSSWLKKHKTGKNTDLQARNTSCTSSSLFWLIILTVKVTKNSNKIRIHKITSSIQPPIHQCKSITNVLLVQSKFSTKYSHTQTFMKLIHVHDVTIRCKYIIYERTST